jgi:hypothetical protein
MVAVVIADYTSRAGLKYRKNAERIKGNKAEQNRIDMTTAANIHACIADADLVGYKDVDKSLYARLDDMDKSANDRTTEMIEPARAVVLSAPAIAANSMHNPNDDVED